MDIQSALATHFQSASAAPFLFIGSGFSRRYLGLEDWNSLLQRFAADLPKPFEYYLSTANSNLPLVAKLMCDDFHEIWWTEEKFADSRNRFSKSSRDRSSALRFEICKYLAGISTTATAESYSEEIKILSRLNVDGIITTNWDLLLETLFPDFKVFVGQTEMIMSHPQMIAEIYKIHGSITKPTGLVLTSDDYDSFHNMNPYLAAKLITLFVEHPIVFIGYSLTDENIISLLRSIVRALGSENLDRLQNNLIFIKRASGDMPSYAKTILPIESVQLPITVVTTDDFTPVYLALDGIKRKIPARVLRYCKEQLYDLVKSSEPGEKMVVVDLDEIDGREDIEFVVGVGVASAHRRNEEEELSLIFAMEETPTTGLYGYEAHSATDLFDDIILGNKGFDPKKIISHTVQQLGKKSKYIPIFKYLTEAGIVSKEDALKDYPFLIKHWPESPNFYRGGAQYLKQFLRSMQGLTAKEIIERNPAEKSAIYLPFLEPENFDSEVILEFLKAHIPDIHSGMNYATFYKKLTCMYDYVVNGERYFRNSESLDNSL